MGFYETAAAGQSFAEDSNIFGEAFSYGGASLIGVFNQAEIEYQFNEYSTRKLTGLVCVSSKPQWVAAGVTPQDRGVLTYNGVTYQTERIDGLNTPGEPAYTLTLKKLT